MFSLRIFFHPIRLRLSGVDFVLLALRGKRGQTAHLRSRLGGVTT